MCGKYIENIEQKYVYSTWKTVMGSSATDDYDDYFPSWFKPAILIGNRKPNFNPAYMSSDGRERWDAEGWVDGSHGYDKMTNVSDALIDKFRKKLDSYQA